jgi:hypothetical protein
MRAAATIATAACKEEGRMHQPVGADQLFAHIRVVLSIILGLGITTLLKGIASIIEHPGRHRWSWIHMGWVAWALMSVVTFWWWEYRLAGIAAWSFESYLFVIAYASLYFLLAALLFPDDVREYGSYEGYWIARRRWFFGLIALITLMDVVDTSLKGAGRWLALGAAYDVRIAVMLLICGVGAAVSRRSAQMGLVLAALVYQAAYFAVEYSTVTAG